MVGVVYFTKMKKKKRCLKKTKKTSELIANPPATWKLATKEKCCLLVYISSGILCLCLFKTKQNKINKQIKKNR